jgi:hypothetical protein
MRILAVTITALALCATASATASAAGKHRLVVRGDATAVAGPCGAAGCPLALTNGRARGTVSGAYTAKLTLKVAKQFPNGEGGICAPLKGRIKFERHLTLAVTGVSCQDGGGPLTGASFTGLATFRVKHGYGGGIATFTEDAAHHHRMTLIGSVRR